MKVEISRDELTHSEATGQEGLINRNRSKSDIEANLYKRDKFCVCIDMKLGVNLIGAFIYFDFALSIYNTIS